MERIDFIKKMAILPILPYGVSWMPGFFPFSDKNPQNRTRPGDPKWPSEATWEKLRNTLQGRLTPLESPLKTCTTDPDGAACKNLFKQLRNPFYISHQPALTQTSGWVGAWSSVPSTYAIEAENTADVAKGVNFARKHNLRLVVKGGGHSYQGRSSSEDSLLIWTRKMNEITLHDDFVPQGGKGKTDPQAAVSIGAGAIWMEAYNAVTTKAGRYVQGGGCTTVGVAGLIQSGGFGSFSKKYGLAAAGLLEAEVVTADGKIQIANAYSHPDLFWALKGGGGGSFGVVTRVTLKTRELPSSFGGAFARIKANSGAAFRRLIGKIIDFYKEQLHNSNWGEEISFWPDNSVGIQLVFQGLSQEQAQKIWAPFQKWVDEDPDMTWRQPLMIATLPARHFWDAEFLKQNIPDLMISDDRTEADPASFLWAGDHDQVGWFLHGFHSAWLSDKLLDKEQQKTLVEALFSSTRHWSVSLHFNKGLSGAPKSEQEKAQNTAMNPAVLDAFALALVAGSDDSRTVWPGVPGYEPNREEAKQRAKQINQAMKEIRKVAPQPASYLSESNYFEKEWQQSFWGKNYSRLIGIKKKYDPNGLFYIHHGVGSEDWTDHGFTRIKS